jgi:4-amino-4-deoxy-L-arabinose transferase-like glycosyltransferase
VSAVVCGTTLLFMRFARLATTDIHLALWVNVANVLLALAVLRGRWWVGCVLGGAALGLAFMSKGPVALVQSVVPVVAFTAWERWGARDESVRVMEISSRRGGVGRVALPVVVGTVVMLAVAIPWFAYVLRKTANDNLGNVWLSEVSRVGATDLEPDPWFNYVAVVPFFFPWVVYLVSGLVVGGQHLWRRARETRLLALFMFLVPILIMSFFKDRKERYLLPMLGPGAVVTGWALMVLARAWRDLKKDERLAVQIHWWVIGIAGVALPLLAATGWLEGLSRADGGAWFGWGVALVAAAVMLGVVIASARWQRWNGWAPVVGTFVFMMVFQIVLTAGYRTSDEAQSQLKPLAEAVSSRAPGVQAYNAMRKKRVPGDLSIYLNQTVREVTRAELRRLERPHLVIMYQDGDDREPPVPPEGSELISKVPRGRHWWYAFLRE